MYYDRTRDYGPRLRTDGKPYVKDMERRKYDWDTAASMIDQRIAEAQRVRAIETRYSFPVQVDGRLSSRSRGQYRPDRFDRLTFPVQRTDGRWGREYTCERPRYIENIMGCTYTFPQHPGDDYLEQLRRDVATATASARRSFAAGPQVRAAKLNTSTRPAAASARPAILERLKRAGVTVSHASSQAVA